MNGKGKVKLRNTWAFNEHASGCKMSDWPPSYQCMKSSSLFHEHASKRACTRYLGWAPFQLMRSLHPVVVEAPSKPPALAYMVCGVLSGASSIPFHCLQLPPCSSYSPPLHYFVLLFVAFITLKPPPQAPWHFPGTDNGLTRAGYIRSTTQ
jgi:hypothetical protein